MTLKEFLKLTLRALALRQSEIETDNRNGHNTHLGDLYLDNILPTPLTSHYSDYHLRTRSQMTSADCHFAPAIVALCLVSVAKDAPC